MLGEPEKVAIEKGLLMLWIIWAAIFGSLFVYIFICHQFGADIRQNINQNSFVPLLRNILYGVAIITLFLIHILRKLMIAGKFGGFQSASLKPGMQSNQPSFLARYTVTLIISLALSESIGIYGLLLFLLGEDFQTLYTFTGISALAMYFYRPKREELENLAVF